MPHRDSVGMWLDRLARMAGDTPALFDRNETISYEELCHRVDRRALQLVGLGVSKATRVGILLPNRAEWLTSAFAVLKLGALLVPLNTLWSRFELEHALRHADVNILITTPRFLRHEYLALLQQIAPSLSQARGPAPFRLRELPCLRYVLSDEADASWVVPIDELPIEANLPWLEAASTSVAASDPAALFFTSGTTAQPKAAVHTHGSLLAAAYGIADRLGLDAADRTWGYLPLFFTGGFVAVALATLSRGGGIVLQETFDPGEAIERMKQARVTTFFAWPHQADAIATHPTFSRSTLRLRKGPGAQSTWADRLFAEDHQAIATWGMTESGPMATCTQFDEPPATRRASHGQPLPGVEIRVTDAESHQSLPAETEGELVIRGATVMSHYYKTSRTDCFDREGFFHTGDRGWLSPEGRFHFLGRIKDVIKSAGASVAAAEVESVLRLHPAVAAAHVVGLPDARRGELVAAFVILSPASPCSPEILLAHCRTHLAVYKVPRILRIGSAEDVPFLGSGKIDTKRLRDLLSSPPG